MKIACLLLLSLPYFVLTLPKKFKYNEYSAMNSNQKTKCIGNNSFLNDNGKCECKSNFPYGDPNSIIGCWNCDPPCGSNAVCYKSNKCKCLEGFIKYGTNNEICKYPIPELVSANPQIGPTSGGTNVILKIKSPPKYTFAKGFCRFGSFSVPAKFSNNSIFICISPFSRKGKVPLAVSFDSSRWSEQIFFFRYYNEHYSMYNCIILFILVIIISMIIIVIFWFLKSKKDFITQSEEMLPLNQWHMNQEQGTTTEENGFLDFMKNIVLN